MSFLPDVTYATGLTTTVSIDSEIPKPRTMKKLKEKMAAVEKLSLG